MNFEEVGDMEFRNCADCVYRTESKCRFEDYLKDRGITPQTYSYCPVADYKKRGFWESFLKAYILTLQG